MFKSEFYNNILITGILVAFLLVSSVISIYNFAEISTEEYNEVQAILHERPDLDAFVNWDMQDGKITKYEFRGLLRLNDEGRTKDAKKKIKETTNFDKFPK